MKVRGIVASFAAACALGWVGGSVFSQDPPMDPQYAEMMKLAQPGEQHEGMKWLVGSWTMKGKFAMPDGNSMETEGTATYTSLLGGRFVQQELNATMMGGPFEGRGLMGYDNFKKKYVGTWIDSMGTGFMTSSGDEVEKGKVWNFSGTYDMPGGPMTSKEVMTKVSDDEFRFEMTMAQGAKPHGTMTLVYTRKK
jgi:hypothetical protein